MLFDSRPHSRPFYKMACSWLRDSSSTSTSTSTSTLYKILIYLSCLAAASSLPSSPSLLTVDNSRRSEALVSAKDVGHAMVVHDSRSLHNTTAHSVIITSEVLLFRPGSGAYGSPYALPSVTGVASSSMTPSSLTTDLISVLKFHYDVLSTDIYQRDCLQPGDQL